MYPVVCIGRYEGTERLRGRRERTYSSLPSSSTRRENLKKCLGQPCFRCTSIRTSRQNMVPRDHGAAEKAEKRQRLNMRSGELREQDLEQGSQQRFPSSSHVVHKLKEAQIQWQVVLEMPRCGRSHDLSSDQKPSMVLTCTS